MINVLEKLLSLIYIQPCYFCGSSEFDGLICPHCLKKINFLPISVFKKILNCDVYVCTIYEDVIKTLILDLKYHHQKKLAKLHARLMFDYLKQLNFKEDYTIIPVPIHKNRQKERKYNHMDIVADELSRLTKFEVNKTLLKRIKDTQKQYKLKRSQRILNLKGAFAVNIETDKNKHLLIIDDITSTGITLKEIIQTLQNRGYHNITALTLATPDIWN